MEPGIRELIQNIGDIVFILIPAAAACALLFFFWGLAQFIYKAKDNADATEKAKGTMLWGLVALFVMVSIWGIVAFIQSDLGITSGVLYL